jgi:4-hydroxy-2-oxoheptanedioate aldolase
MNLLEEFRKKLETGAPVFGCFMKTSDPAFAEIAGYAGFDFVVLDMEHGPVSFENMQNLIRGALLSGTLPVVRTSDERDISIGRSLDMGALGVQVPQVRTASEARSVIRAARFHPEGERGVCVYVRAAAYSSIDPKEYFQEANRSLVILQLEGKEALDNLDSILEVEGIDILFIGPFDLSQSLGYPGETDHPEVVAAMKRIVEKATARGIITGTFTSNPEAVSTWKDAGIQYLSYSVDTGIFTDACKGLVSRFKGL